MVQDTALLPGDLEFQQGGKALGLCVKTPETLNLNALIAGIMLGRMGNSGVPLVSFCQCLNESVMKIVAVAVW